MPCSSDTTAMIEVTATTLPSTTMIERILFTQMDDSAIPMASRIWVMSGYGLRTTDYGLRAPGSGLRAGDSPRVKNGKGTVPLRLGRARRRTDFHFVSILQIPNRIEWAGDHLVAVLQAGEHLEVLVAGNAHLDLHERRFVVAENEDALD